jgi:hypothetical protein
VSGEYVVRAWRPLRANRGLSPQFYIVQNYVMHFALNGFDVEPSLMKLMLRGDWSSKRTDPRWLEQFPAHPDCESRYLPFVEFCSLQWAERENAAIRKPENAILLGKKNLAYPPGDFDPTAGYVIGFTEMADAPICIDLRPPTGPQIIYDCLASQQVYATAFTSIAAFVRFYIDLHGE